MILLQHIFLGFVIGFVGVIPPGLLNLTAAKIRIAKSLKSALFFISGACLIVIGQVYIGVFFSKLIIENDEVLSIMEQLSIVIFLLVSIFYFIKAIKFKGTLEPKVLVKTEGFKMIGQGMLLSLLNIFPIPFYIGFSSFLAGRGLFIYQFPEAHLFITGAVMGTFLMMFLYVRYIKELGFDSEKFQKSTNYLIAFLTLFIALFTAIKTF